MTWQDWAVALFLTLCVINIGRRILNFYHKVKEDVNPCETCDCDCEIKRLQNRQQVHRCEMKKKTKKSCCG